MSKDLTTLFMVHYQEIGGYLRRKVGDATEASDLCQDAFVRCAQLQDTVAIENPRGFIFTMVANLALDHMRRFVRRRKIEIYDANYETAALEPSAEDVYAAHQQEKILQKAIDELPAKTRTVFIKYYVEGTSYRDIGKELRISPRTVEYHLRQALSYCRAEAQNAGLT